MSARDSQPIPVKGRPFRVEFPIFDKTGNLVSGATGLDSEISKNSGTFTNCLNEATEIATSSGMYYLDLTGDETYADVVALIVKTTSTDARTTPIVLYPREEIEGLVRLGSSSLEERGDIESGTIDKAGFPHYGIIFTEDDGETPVGSNLEFDTNILEGALIENNDGGLSAGQERYFQILGGYYFEDSGDTISKVFGIALESAFGLKEGGARISTKGWDGTNIDEATHGDGWTFIVASKSITDDLDAPFPTSGQKLKIWINPAYRRASKIETRFPGGAVYFDRNSDFDGTASPNGVAARPVNDIDDVGTIADNNNLHIIKANLENGTVSVGTNNKLNHKKIIGIGDSLSSLAKLDLGTYINHSAYFENIRINMGHNTNLADLYFLRCIFVHNSEFNYKNIADQCIFEGALKLYDDNQFLRLLNCRYTKNAQLDFSTYGGSTGEVIGGKGVMECINMTDGTFNIYDFEGDITIAASCTLGTINIFGGKGRLITTGAITTVNNYGFIDQFDSMIEYSGAVPRYTAAALINAPIASVGGLLTTSQFNTKIPSNFSFSGGNVNSNIEMIDTVLVKDDNAGHLLVKNEDAAKIGTDANQTTIINHLADIKGTGWGVNDNLKDIRADTNEIQGKLPSGNIAGAGEKMDLVDTLKHIAGSSGYDRTTDSLEAIGAAAADIVSKATLKDIMFNRDVLTRHPSGPGAGKPKTIAVGTSGAEGTITTTLDGEHVDTEVIV